MMPSFRISSLFGRTAEPASGSESREVRLFGRGDQSRQATLFSKELTRYLIGQNLGRALDLIEQSDDLYCYLFYLFSRQGEKARASLHESTLREFKAFIEEVGHGLEELIPGQDLAMNAGRGFKGFLEIIAHVAYHHVMEPRLTYVEHAQLELLTASLGDREMIRGTLISLPTHRHPFWCVDFSEERAGAFIYVLRPIEDNREAIVVCRGTALRPKGTGAWMSVFNDMVSPLGIVGAEASWGDLAGYLRSEQIESATFMGKSLGGAFAGMLALFVQHLLSDCRVSELLTLQSPGDDDSVHELYDKLPPELRFPIKKYNLAQLPGMPDDYVPKVGGHPLGHRSPGSLQILDVGFDLPGHQIRHVKTGGKSLRIFTLIRALSSTHAIQMRHRKIKIIRRTLKPSVSFKPGSEKVLEMVRRKTICRIAAIMARVWPTKLGFVPLNQFIREQRRLNLLPS